MIKSTTALLMASALAFAPTFATAASKDRGGTVTLEGTVLTLSFVNRGDCQSTASKLRNGVRALVPGSNSNVNALAKPITNAVCKSSPGKGPVVSQIDLATVPGLTPADIAAIQDFIEQHF